MDRLMPRIFIRCSLGIGLLGALVFAGSVISNSTANAGQSISSSTPYSTVDPFDPSEVVSHSLKDDIRLRLRLPAPDLPPSVVQSAQPQKTRATLLENKNPSTVSSSRVTKEGQSGVIAKSIQSVMSIFDWSNDAHDEEQTSDPVNSDDPIRINIHVGIKKPAEDDPDASEAEEVSSLKDPWTRSQERVRRLFTLDQIKAHN